MELAILISVYHNSKSHSFKRLNRLHLLNKCIYSLVSAKKYCLNFQQSWNKIDIIIIDDYSDKKIIDFIEEEIKNEITVFQNEGVKGQAGALNYGISKLSHEYLAFTDSDCIVSINWIQTIFEHYINFPNHIGVVGNNWLFQNGTNLWSKILTKQESKLMKYNFLKYVDFDKQTVQRIDCRNFSINSNFIKSNYKSEKFFLEDRGPSVSGQASHILRNKLLRTNTWLGYSIGMQAFHAPVLSLKEQVYAYYTRGKFGQYKNFYLANDSSLTKVFLLKYVNNHFIKPVIKGNNLLYTVLLHTSYWIGILLSKK